MQDIKRGHDIKIDIIKRRKNKNVILFSKQQQCTVIEDV